MKTTALPEKISGERLEALVTEAVDRFFTTMVGTDVLFMNSDVVEEKAAAQRDLEADEPPPAEELPIKTKGLVVAAVGFCGELDGVAYLYFTETLAENVTCGFLGMEMEDVRGNHEVVNDALGEVANMTIGTIKNTLSQFGYECRLTVPSIVRGSNFTIQSASGVHRQRFQFKLYQEVLLLDMMFKKTA
ncbi:MAG: hypothetical protein E1N59_65 [Puniceicoccaceae bacterium 5H]|nr:MAG: hypothetical protein E1N59_65 [Puniceicoccaceae bacterium 5H]